MQLKCQVVMYLIFINYFTFGFILRFKYVNNSDSIMDEMIGTKDDISVIMMRYD